MEQKHKKKLKQRFDQYINDQRIIYLGIPDNYKYMDERLITILKRVVPPFVQKTLICIGIIEWIGQKLNNIQKRILLIFTQRLNKSMNSSDTPLQTSESR